MTLRTCYYSVRIFVSRLTVMASVLLLNSGMIRLSTAIHAAIVTENCSHARETSTPRFACRRPRACRGVAEIPGTPGWRAVFVTFISRQVHANIAHFLSEFGCNARIIRIELERGGGGRGGKMDDTWYGKQKRERETDSFFFEF